MTIDSLSQKNISKYGPTKKLKPFIEKILEVNPKGLTFIKIVSELMKLKKELAELGINFIERRDVSIALRSGYFRKEIKGKRTIYKIRPS